MNQRESAARLLGWKMCAAALAALAPVFALVALIAMSGLGGAAGAQPSPGSTDPGLPDPGLPDPMAPGLELRARLDALIARVKIEQGRVTTMQATFEQHKQSTLLLEPETARGLFYYQAPESVRWEYRSPNPIVMVIDGQQLTTFYPDLKRAERLAVDRLSEQIFKYLGAGGSLETLTKYFWLTARFPKERGGAYQIELKPRYQRVARRLAGIEMTIDGVSFLPMRLRYAEPSGDTTEYRFADVRVNQPLPPDQFRLVLPADVTISRAGSE